MTRLRFVRATYCSRANTTELVGAVVLVEDDHPNLMLSDKTLRMVPASAKVSRSLLLYALRTKRVRAIFEEATGTSDSMRNLTQEKIRAAPIPLPPAVETRHLTRQMLEAFVMRSSLRRRLESVLVAIARMDNAALGKAFRGELLSGEPPR